MPKFSPDSFSKLSTCHIDLQVLFYEVIKTVDCTILQGYRNEADQNEDFKMGRSRLLYPESKHNSQPAMAVDVIMYPANKANIKGNIWFAGYVQGIAQRLKDDGKMTHSIRWGASWDGLGLLDHGNQLYDDDHFELVS